MRDKCLLSGKTVKTKSGVGHGMQGYNLIGMDFEVEDWCENVLGCSWMNANGNPAALEYAMRIGFFGQNNNVDISNDVVYGKINGLGHLFHVNELEIKVGDLIAD